ncbi:MAG: conjugal transfer protein TraI [Gammaproteobacteria bacterium]|nr:conjugal transfer protein TraI [Gammaproteobacteria bacterium]
MADDKDDIFKPKLGRIRSLGGVRSKNYLNRVLHQISAAGKTGFGTATAARRFSGYRIGRGNDALRHRRAGHRFEPSYRRVVIKTRIVKLKAGGLDAARSHLRYIQRDGVSKEHEPGRLYDAAHDEADGKGFLDRSEGDRHQFRFIVSPEDATELYDLKPFVRDLMAAMEEDLDTRLDWVAVDHFNTEHPHSHIVLRGKDDLAKDLVIARDYIAHGMRRRASEIVTLELGPQTEQELRQKLERQVEQEHFTDLDRSLVRDTVDGIVDARSDAEYPDARSRHAIRVGRLRVLAGRGLAEETVPGRWRLSPQLEETLRRAGQRGDIIKTMHRGLRQAGLDAGASEFSIYDSGDPRAPTITGRIIDRGLHDELNDGHYVMVDASDGRVHYVALDPRQDVEDLPLGAVVEVTPAATELKPSDRAIAQVGRRNGGLYSRDAHHEADPRASAEFVQAHVRRLEALRRQNVVRRFADGSWEIPDDFEDRVETLAKNQARYPGQVVALSFLTLEQQVKADGATWLDRQLLAKEPTPLRGDRFGAASLAALHQRQDHLVEQGLADRNGQTVRYQRNLLRLLRRQELAAAGDRIAKETGLAFAETRDGDRIEGVYRRSVHLASGKFAVIEKSKEFTLVPWRPMLERQRGKIVSGVMRGPSASFDLAKKRGIGIG